MNVFHYGDAIVYKKLLVYIIFYIFCVIVFAVQKKALPLQPQIRVWPWKKRIC